jgi:Tfp pilus assembly protein PilE
MKLIKRKLNSNGFSHLEILIVAVVVIAIGSIGYFVVRHNHKNTKTANLTSAKVANKSSTTPQLKASSTSPVTSTSKSTASTSTPTTTKTSSTTAKSTGSTPSSTSSTSSASASPAAPAATPLSTLTGIISSLDSGGSANVTANSVTVPGPISNATARPIVFTLNGQTYYAYTQGSEPNFNTSASQTASTMAIVTTSAGASLTTGHLDKTGILVDQNEMAVGYSTGGN